MGEKLIYLLDMDVKFCILIENPNTYFAHKFTVPQVLIMNNFVARRGNCDFNIIKNTTHCKKLWGENVHPSIFNGIQFDYKTVSIN